MTQRPRLSTPDDLELLGNPSWHGCETLIKEFEEAWQRGDAPVVADYLRAEGNARRGLLLELVHIDLEFRLRAGQPRRVEAYLQEFPELSERRQTLGLLAAEYELRQRYAGDADPEEYRARFPHHFDELLHCFRPSAVADTLVPSAVGRSSGPPPVPNVPGYEILEELGRGGMGIVYKARETSLGRLVALKFLPTEYTRDADRLERFLREARTASALNHPHICTVHALGNYEGRPFIVMEHIDGRTLHALQSQPGALPIDEIARVLGEACRALAAAHAAGVVHRDIKPENLMVRQDGYVKVLDFGLARQLPTLTQPNPLATRETDPGAILGTAAYMSPEQARGEPTDSASDLFSLGIVLYELTTGRHPFEAESAFAMLYAIATRRPVPANQVNPDIPVALASLIEGMLNKDARLRPTAAEVEAALAAALQRPVPVAAEATPPRPIVRREPELIALRQALAAAEAGRGGVVCVGGEPGIGKTTLVEDFLGELAGRGVLVARGYCSERLADTEAYLPVIDALGGLLRGEGGDSVARVMKVVAPTWYAHVAPGRGAAEERGASSQQAMLREFRALVEEVSHLGPVVLFFDDVHWADVSTVDLLAHLGRHGPRMRLLVIVTYRPTELLLGPHPFHHVKLDLQGKGAGTDLALDFLDRGDIDSYLALAFPGHAFSGDFADLIYARTEGSPLFMADLLRYLRERGVLAEADGRWAVVRELAAVLQEVPGSVRGMIQRKLDRLADGDRRLLAAAAVQGSQFDSAVVAAALKLDAAEAEERLQVLDRVHGLVRLVREDELPDRTLTLRYAFVHALYQQALYHDLPPTRRAALGLALARALEERQGIDADPAAAALACLFEVGRDFGQASRLFWVAAQNAARVFAHREAVALARRGLRLLRSLPETPGRGALELPLQMTLGLQLQVTEGYAAPGAREAYARARDLCPRTEGGSPPFPVLWGLWLYHKVRSELVTAQALADELQAVAKRESEPDLALQAHQALGMTAFCRGRPGDTVAHVEQATALYNQERHGAHSFVFGQDPGVICKAFGAVAVWLLGHAGEAERQSQAAVEMTRGMSPTNQSVALHFASMVRQMRRDGAGTRERAEAAVSVAAEHGFAFWRAGGGVLGGWALAATGAGDDGLRRLQQGLTDWATTGSVTYRTYYLGLLAEVLGWQGRYTEARTVLDEALALVEQSDERFWEAELLRLDGETRWARGEKGAEERFQKAVAVARSQQARSLELRAATSLARRLPGEAARAGLAAVAGWFTEETPDVREAKAVLGG